MNSIPADRLIWIDLEMTGLDSARDSILEIATVGPGFLIDEDPSSLGTTLSLPEWLETERPLIESLLAPIAP